ncbi:MAG TPA: FkbM family methyltransferase [Prolixibacteraceae bacterium]|nr:FkbM family methyltransferase [Prolixibacteraceae bacterium]
MNPKKILYSFFHRWVPQLLYKNNSYSQEGEDRILAAFYTQKKGYKGFYVDVGAHHPFRFSNTASFYKRGWRGINIEPSPSLIAAFRRHRKRDLNLQCAVGDGSPAVFHMYNDMALNTFSTDLVIDREKRVGDQYFVIKKMEIPTFPLAQILEDNLAANQKIDFMSVDVEGLDLEVLKTNDWERFRPDFVIVECFVSNLDLAQNEIFQFLSEKGYLLYGMSHLNGIFISNNAR